jgi:23S rRNA (uracil1939-C5)-methyltransferase
VEARVARIGADGDGIAELPDGTPLYLAGTLPGEIVLAQPGAKRGEGRAATVAAVIAASPERAAPPCPHFHSCGGCTLQHWQDAPYRAWKTGLLEAALRRAGFAPVLAPLVITPPGARRRMDMSIRRQGASVVVGLHAGRTAEVIDLTACPVLHPDLFALVAPLRAALRGLALLRRSGSVVANLLENGSDLLLRSDAEPNTTDRSRLTAFAQAHGVCRISWARGEGPTETLCLLRPPVAMLSGVAVRPPPGAFLQASEVGEAAIVAAVLAGLPDKLPARARVVELYAGCGTLSFALASRLRVAAYEGDADLVAALRAATNAQGLAGRIAVEQRDLARRPVMAAELSTAAAVVLDPPYGGAAGQIAQVAAARPQRVVYVSCNPAALARDAAVLHNAGYSVATALPIDQFLWSARLESVVVFIAEERPGLRPGPAKGPRPLEPTP